MTFDRTQVLIEAAESLPSYFLHYTRLRNKVDQLPIFVFEGIDDPKYYTPRVSQVFGSNWWPLSVRGKDNVIGLREVIDKNTSYNKDQVSYYIDSDFDSLAITNNLYVTPSYSVENFYTHSASIRHLLHTSGQMSQYENEEVHNAIEFVTNKYVTYREIYINSKAIRYMNVFFLYVRKRLEDKKISFDSLFTIEHSIGNEYSFVITLKPKFVAMKKQIAFTDFLSFAKSNPIALKILKAQTNKYRGKQELAFVREFIQALKSENSDLNQAISESTGVKIKFRNNAIGNDLLLDLSALAETPTCLVTFLNNLYREINPSNS